MEGLEFTVAQKSFQLLEFDQWEYYNHSLSTVLAEWCFKRKLRAKLFAAFLSLRS